MSSYWGGFFPFALFVCAVVGLMCFELGRFPLAVPIAQNVACASLFSGVGGFLLSFGSSLLQFGEHFVFPYFLFPAIVAGSCLVCLGVRSVRFIGVFAVLVYAGQGLVLLYSWWPELVIVVVLNVIGTDVGGYFVGKIIGGPKFAPKTSPKKTWSGILGGWIFGVGAACFYWFYFELESTVSTIHLVLILLCLSWTSQLGDLGISGLKRRVGVKNSSELIPGHGGFLDRFDSLIGGGVFAYLLYMMVPPRY